MCVCSVGSISTIFHVPTPHTTPPNSSLLSPYQSFYFYYSLLGSLECSVLYLLCPSLSTKSCHQYLFHCKSSPPLLTYNYTTPPSNPLSLTSHLLPPFPIFSPLFLTWLKHNQDYYNDGVMKHERR